MGKKYFIREDGRIVATRSFGDIKEGDVGGFVEKEDNLSHEGLCWVFDNARVSENARVSGDAYIYGHVYIKGRAHIYDRACIFDHIYIEGDVHIGGYTHLKGDAHIGNPCLYRRGER